MPTTIDPWEKAADCERSAKATIDPHRKARLQKLRDLWVRLGNDRSFMSDADVASKAEDINRMHLDLMAAL